MGNSSRKAQRPGAVHRAAPRRNSGRRSSGRSRASGRRRGRDGGRGGGREVEREGGAEPCAVPQPGDVMFGSPIPSVSLLAIHEDQLLRMRRDIELDPEGFLLDNLLFGVQFFKNYEYEMWCLREAAGLQAAPLAEVSRRALLPDALLAAAGRHVRWRGRSSQPDSLLAPQRHYVLSDNVRLISGAPSGQHEAPHGLHGPHHNHYHIAVEAAAKAGYVKLRRMRAVDLQEDSDDSTPSTPRAPRRLGLHASTPDIPAATQSPFRRRGRGAEWGSTPALPQDLHERAEWDSMQDLMESSPDVQARLHPGQGSTPDVHAPDPPTRNLLNPPRFSHAVSTPDVSRLDTFLPPRVPQHDDGLEVPVGGVSRQREELSIKFNSRWKSTSNVAVESTPRPPAGLPPEQAEEPRREGNCPKRRPLWASSQLTDLLAELQQHPLFRNNADEPVPHHSQQRRPSASAGSSPKAFQPQSAPPPPLRIPEASARISPSVALIVTDHGSHPTLRVPFAKARTEARARVETTPNSIPKPDVALNSTIPRTDTTTPDTNGRRGSSPTSSAGRRGPGSVASGKSSRASVTSDLSSSSVSRHSPPVPLEDFRLGATPQDPDAIPDECFQPHMVVETRHQSGVRAISGVLGNEDDGPETEMRMQMYLSPALFMASFADVFADVLAGTMGFPRESVAGAMVRPGVILCERAAAGTLDQCEVVPALRLPSWPHAAAEWVFRDRASWPPASALRRIHELGAAVLPTPVLLAAGASSSTSTVATGSSRSVELQWGLAFPDAERLLELSLSATQAHGYLSLLAMQRCFVEPACRGGPGVSAQHMRCFFLWQCERFGEDSAPWLRLGRTLRAQLADLYTALQTRALPDYFVRKRNLLAELPLNTLRRVQERVFRLREKLFPNVLHACRKLAYVEEGGGDFYPRLDYDRLATILASETQDSAGQHVRADVGPQADWKANYRRQVEQERAALAASNATKASELSLQLGLYTEQTKIRTCNVLIFFCKHFSKMAQCSAKFGATEQSLQYLQHCYHLLTILQEDYGCGKSAVDILNDIKKAEATLLKTLLAAKQSYGPPANFHKRPGQQVLKQRQRAH